MSKISQPVLQWNGAVACCIYVRYATASLDRLLAHVHGLVLIFETPQRAGFLVPAALKDQLLHGLQQDDHIDKCSAIRKKNCQS